MNFSDDTYRTMLDSFRTNDLQSLLGAFNRNKVGRKSELKERALNLLQNCPTGFNHQAYLSKIVEISRSLQSVVPSNDMLHNMSQNRQFIPIGMQSQQQRIFHSPSYMPRAGLPQTMGQVQRNIFANAIPGNSNMQYTYQSASVSHNVSSHLPPNQQINMPIQNPVRFDLNPSALGSISLNQSPQSLINVKLKKLPFYEVIDNVIKPFVLYGQERCTLQNIPKGMREVAFKFVISPDHVNLIAMNRDISGGKNDYVYQMQIRICLQKTTNNETTNNEITNNEITYTEITDYMPLSLHIRVSNKVCPLPPTAPNTRPGTESRRTPRPINCTHLLKLNPSIANLVQINWNPDGQTYIMAINLVKKLSSEYLLQNLKDKGLKSPEETKNYIIKKLADIDPDLATTSYRFSLVCPLGKMRMKIPAKSVKCNHLQCFDARIFLLMNEKKPTWTCPTCNNSCLYDDIHIESYFLEILTSSTLPDNCKEIEILSDGTWRVYEENNEVKNTESTSGAKDTPIDSVNLDSDDENTSEIKKEQSTKKFKDSENLKSSFVDLTLSDDDSQSSGKQENEAQAADAKHLINPVDLKPQAQVQPQQAVTSSEQGEVIEIDSPSPPSSPIPTTSSS